MGLTDFEKGILEGYEKAANCLILLSDDPVINNNHREWILIMKRQEEQYMLNKQMELSL